MTQGVDSLLLYLQSQREVAQIPLYVTYRWKTETSLALRIMPIAALQSKPRIAKFVGNIWCASKRIEIAKTRIFFLPALWNIMYIRSQMQKIITTTIKSSQNERIKKEIKNLMNITSKTTFLQFPANWEAFVVYLLRYSDICYHETALRCQSKRI